MAPPKAPALEATTSTGTVSSSNTGSITTKTRNVMAMILNPFSAAALKGLPDTSERARDRELRTTRVPDDPGAGGSVEVEGVGQPHPHSDYHSINPVVRVPKKVATPIRVEGKVWFANERTWLSYLNIALLIGTLAIALLNSSKDDVARNFGLTYAAISLGVLVYGWAVYQKRITMIRKRDPGHFDQILGPVIISALLFLAVLANFVIRVSELKKKITIPDDYRLQ